MNPRTGFGVRFDNNKSLGFTGASIVVVSFVNHAHREWRGWCICVMEKRVMMHRALLATGMICAAAGTSHAAIFFTFDDPDTPLEVSYVAGDGGGAMSYSSEQPVELVVDAAEEGIGTPLTFQTMLVMDLNIGAAQMSVDLPGGFSAAVNGTFTFFTVDGARGNGAVEILRGEISSGRLVANSSAGAVISTAGLGDLTYIASGGLASEFSGAGIGSILPGLDAVFTLTNISPFISATGDTINSFDANAAFTGTAIPTPSALGLLTLGGVAIGARRRRDC